MRQLSGIRISRRKALFLGGLVAVMILATWLFCSFDGGTSDEAKYREMCRLWSSGRLMVKAIDQLPPGINRLLDLQRRIILKERKFIRLNNELFVSGYLTNVTLEVTNINVVKNRLEKEFPSRKDWGMSSGGNFVSITCRTQDVELVRQATQGTNK